MIIGQSISTYNLFEPSQLFNTIWGNKKLPTVKKLSSPKPVQAQSKPAIAPQQPTLTTQSTFFQDLIPSISLFSSTAPTLPLPARAQNALSGSQFWDAMEGKTIEQREQAIQQEILAGNIPDHLRQYKTIEVSARGKDGQMHTAQVNVMPDYLAIGSNDDYVLVPMRTKTAQAIANATGSTLPTRKLVNDIYKNSEVKLAPRPQKPGPQMMSTPYLEKHDKTVQAQRQKSGARAGQLISGHKKDLVMTNRLNHRPNKMAIYGWHLTNGKAIQPLSTYHFDGYVDYSHGARLIAPQVVVDGVTMNTKDVLKDPNLVALLSDEGVIADTRIKRR